MSVIGFLRGLFRSKKKVDLETIDGPPLLLEGRTGLLNIPLYARTLGYNICGMSSEETIVATRCPCMVCRYSCNPGKVLGLRRFNLDRYAILFPPIEYVKVNGDPEISFEELANVVKYDYVKDPGNRNAVNGLIRVFRRANIPKLLRILTYLAPAVGALTPYQIQELAFSCSCLYDINLDDHLAKYDRQMTKDFLRQVMILFVQSWDAYSGGDGTAQHCAIQMSRFLTHIIRFPSIAAVVFEVITTSTFWPKMGPVPILELFFGKYLCCTDTAALLCNLTRIKEVAEYLSGNTQCVHNLRNHKGFVKALAQPDPLGLLLMNLTLNLIPYEGFAKFLIESSSGHIMDSAIWPLIEATSTYSPKEKAVWPLLRNLLMTEEGRKYVVENLHVFLGRIVYPLVGSEELTSEDQRGLPVEVLGLPPTQQRVEDKLVRECILDIFFLLSRFKKDRDLLRTTGIDKILKYYQLAEEDGNLLEKVDVIVNVLMCKDRSEIDLDDLFSGLSLNEQKNGFATSGVVTVLRWFER